MKYKLLGKSGLRVSELCLGTMTFGEDWQWGSSKEESRKIFDAFIQQGGNFIDTANFYTNGTSEKLVGDFIAAERERFVVATKFTCNMRPEDINAGGNHRKNITQSLEASLKRLKVEYLDLYWLHAWDFTTPVEEVMRTLDDAVRAGKVLYIGISDTPAWIIAQANTLATLRGWTPFVALQIEYNLLERTPERELLPMAHAFELTVTPWSPLAGGILSGKYNAPTSSIDGKRKDSGWLELTTQKLAIARQVEQVARDLGRTSSQVALNWLFQMNPDCVPIIGARTLAQVEDNLKCIEFQLSSEHLNALNAVSNIELGFPHDFFRREGIRKAMYGNTYSLLNKYRL